MGALGALQEERAKLVEGNRAYTEAHAILYVLGLDAETQVVSMDDGSHVDIISRHYEDLEVVSKAEVDLNDD